LVSAVVPDATLTSVTTELAGKLAAGPTVAYAAIKDTVGFASSHTLSESLAREAQSQARCGASLDHIAAVAAFLAKQPAAFIGR
jgi:2-(1,2-epoxy-1,2-dihydrophenyl)acetyl-CoA isomerase